MASLTSNDWLLASVDIGKKYTYNLFILCSQNIAVCNPETIIISISTSHSSEKALTMVLTVLVLVLA